MFNAYTYTKANSKTHFNAKNSYFFFLSSALRLMGKYIFIVCTSLLLNQFKGNFSHKVERRIRRNSIKILEILRFITTQEKRDDNIAWKIYL